MTGETHLTYANLKRSLNKVDESFFDDSLDLFMGFNGGHLGKYCYDGTNWDAVLGDRSSYYIPKADNELVHLACETIDSKVCTGAPYVDFGVGGIKAFEDHALPLISKIHTKDYVAVDCCSAAIERTLTYIQRHASFLSATSVEVDFFSPLRRLSKIPAIGVMNGVTLTNMYGTLKDRDVARSLVCVLRNLSYAVANGWLLVSFDTNQDDDSLNLAYRTHATSQLYLNVFKRLVDEGLTKDFSPDAFVYDPEWHPELQLFAHMARATEDQDFLLGGYRVSVAKGQKFHLLNSYKFSAAFFETCCDRAGLDIAHVWHHETPVKLYLLKDRTCPV